MQQNIAQIFQFLNKVGQEVWENGELVRAAEIFSKALALIN